MVYYNDRVKLSDTKALAISYTWGEFERKKVKLGQDIEGKAVEMELEKEWDIQETIVRLAMLCLENGEAHGSEHAGIWIDQLSISQTDDTKIPASLASIPNIYQTLDVVVLVPGGICGCLQKTYERVLASPEVRQWLERYCQYRRLSRDAFTTYRTQRQSGLCEFLRRLLLF
jgi:hypothetical protein